MSRAYVPSVTVDRDLQTSLDNLTRSVNVAFGSMDRRLTPSLAHDEQTFQAAIGDGYPGQFITYVDDGVAETFFLGISDLGRPQMKQLVTHIPGDDLYLPRRVFMDDGLDYDLMTDEGSSLLQIKNALDGDASIQMSISEVQDWSIGVDNSDSDKFKVHDITAGVDALTLDISTGNATFSGTVSATGLNLSGLTASRLMSTDASKNAASVTDLTPWVAGGAGATVADDGDGTITINVTGSGIDHGLLSGLADDDHTIYILADGSRAYSGDIDLDGNNLSDGGVVFLREQAAADLDVANQGQLWVKTGAPNTFWFTNDAGTDQEIVYAGGAYHDGFSDFVANEHIDWTAASDAFATTGAGAFGDDLVVHDTTVDGSPEFHLGSGGGNESKLVTAYKAGTIQVGSLTIRTDTTSLTADDGRIRMVVDSALTMEVLDDGINLVSGHTYQINDVDILTATTLGSSVVNSSLTSVAEAAVTAHEAAINHDALTNFVANEHIDWTGASSNFDTTGTGQFDGSVTVGNNAASNTYLTMNVAGSHEKGINFNRGANTDASLIVESTENLVLTYGEADLGDSFLVKYGSGGTTVATFGATGDLSLAFDLRVEGDIGLAADTNLLQLASGTLDVNGKTAIRGTAGTSGDWTADYLTVVGTTGADMSLQNTGNGAATFRIDSDRTNANANIGQIKFYWASNAVATIFATGGGDNTNKDDGELHFQTSNDASSPLTRFIIDQDGGVHYQRNSSSSDPTVKANYAAVYSKDVGGSAEIFVQDEGSNVTQLSPHDSDGNWYFNSYSGKKDTTLKVHIEQAFRFLIKAGILPPEILEEYEGNQTA